MTTRRVSVVVDADLSPFNRAMLSGVASARGFAHELESADSRFASILQTGLALTPALVPLGAIGIPAAAGLAAQLGATAAAAGVTVLAFQGVGDALKALNDYQIDPTEAHLKKLRQTMDALGPAGQLFVRTLQDLRPELQDLQDIAQQGMLPGLTDSIHELKALEPEVEKIIGTIAGTIGDLAAQAGDELNDQRWVDFIDFLDREATPTLKAMGKTLGYVVEGLASMMMDFDPLADDFTQGMVGYARAFRDWADGLDQTQGFEDFVDYIRANGPEALETLAALGGALVSLVTAAAPVGAALLPVIEATADGLSAIADSNVGPALITAAAGIGTLGRALALLKAVGLRGDGSSILGQALNVGQIKQAVPAMGAYSAATRELQAAETAAAAAHTRYIGALKANSVAMTLVPGRQASENMVKVTDDLVAANKRQASAARSAQAAEARRAATLRASLSGIGRAAGVVGGLAFATSGYAEKTGLANSATYAMLGMIAGPWGAAIGGGIGLAMDFAAANNDIEQAIRAANAAMNSGDLELMQAKLQALNEAIDTSNEKLSVDISWNPFKMSKENIDAMLSGVNELATGANEAATQTRDDLKSAFDEMTQGVTQLGVAFGTFHPGEQVDELARLDAVLEQARPAMDALGISTTDLGDAVRDGSINDLVSQIVGYTKWADSAAGRTKRIADAMAGLDDQLMSTKQSAADLKSALDDLLDPNISLVRATDEWTTALRHLEDDLAKHNKTLVGNSDAAIKNREAINQRVDSLKQLLGAEADAGASSRKLANELKAQKKALIDAGDAAGISRGQMVAYLKTLGLTPKLVQTLVEAHTDQARTEIKAINDLLAKIPRSVRTGYYVTQIPVRGPYQREEHAA